MTNRPPAGDCPSASAKPRRGLAALFLRCAATGALVLLLAATAASAATDEAPVTATPETSTSVPAGVSSTPAAEAQPGTSEESGTSTGTQTTTTAPTETTPTPEVQAQSGQVPSQQAPVGHARGLGGSGRRGHGKARPQTGAKGGASTKNKNSTLPAPQPSALTPPFPGSLGSAIGGIPNFFIESFSVPPFLLPIYQAAGTAYGIPWQVLAAINEVETDYGRDLSVSSAGAEGWMQFLPSSWARYGVDVNGDGYEDPYNPADAIFAAAKYLAAADGSADIRGAIYSYNHSQAYVDAVMLRAQLLGGTPPELLSAITGLTESRFPVHAQSHFADGFPTASASGSSQPVTLVGTTIYAPAGAPVVAVQDGQIVAIGDSPTLGHYVSLRDAYGNTYTYAQLASVAALYPVLEPRHGLAAVDSPSSSPDAKAGPRPSAPASAGVQPHSPLSEAAVSSGLAMGAAAALETPPAPTPTAPPPVLPAPPPASTPRVFSAGPDEVYLHELHPGVEVLAGTVLGHLGSGSEAEESPSVQPVSATQTSVSGGTEAHMLFQIRPAGAGAPLIDPKPILDGWVRLENTSVFRAKGRNPFLASSPSVGQVLLESKPQLERQVLRDAGVRFASKCGRGEVQAGQVDRRVLATLEFLSVSGLKPTVSSLGCGAGGAADNSAGDVLDISAIDGTPIAGHEEPGSLADIAVHRLLRLQGTMKPRQIATGSLSYPGTVGTLTLPADRGLIHVDFEALSGARAARVQSSPLTPEQWLRLVARLGEIPNPVVAGKPSSAAISDNASAAAGNAAGDLATSTGGG
jgi:Transglycosylase SLT domain